MIFERRPTHTFLGCVWSHPRNRSDKREEDHYVYFDSDTGQYFVVESVEHASGPNVSGSDEIVTIEEYLRLHPERRTALESAISRHRKPSRGGEGPFDSVGSMECGTAKLLYQEGDGDPQEVPQQIWDELIAKARQEAADELKDKNAPAEQALTVMQAKMKGVADLLKTRMQKFGNPYPD
jgi:hypothetical protein